VVVQIGTQSNSDKTTLIAGTHDNKTRFIIVLVLVLEPYVLDNSDVVCVRIQAGRQTVPLFADLTETSRSEIDAEMMSLSSQLLHEQTRRRAAEKKLQHVHVFHSFIHSFIHIRLIDRLTKRNCRQTDRQREKPRKNK